MNFLHTTLSGVFEFISSMKSDGQVADPSSSILFLLSLYGLRQLYPLRKLVQKGVNPPSGWQQKEEIKSELTRDSKTCAYEVSERAKSHFMTPPLHYFSAWLKAVTDQYDPITNPKGSIPMAVAENKLMVRNTVCCSVKT